MKKAFFLTLLLLVTTPFFGRQNSLFFLTEDYTKYFLLELNLNDNTYIFSVHSVKRIQIDKGSFFKKGNTIVLKSETKYFGFNPYLHKKIYLKKSKLYLSKIEMFIGKNGINNTLENEIGLDYKFENLDEFTSNTRIKVERKSESMNQFRGIEFKKNFLEILSLRLPSYSELVTRHYLDPEDYVFYSDNKRVDWSQDVSGYAILDMFSTIIHESVHNANGSDSILLFPDSLVRLERTEVVPTKTMTSFFEERCTTDSIFRFDTYIGESSENMASNVAGIYGLMNEFSAYYHDTKSAYLMYKKYEELGKDYEYCNYLMAADAIGTYYAYYEFNLFIGGYLSYLKINNPKIYSKTINNQSLCLIYTQIDAFYKEIVQNIETELSEDENYIYFYNKHVKFPKKDLQQFLPELENLKTKMLAEN